QATEAEQTAARELVDHLKKITCAKFAIQPTLDPKSRKSAIIVGPGEAASQFFPELDLTKLGPEEFVMRVKDGRLLLTGGRPRGTLYAVYHFLQEQCGCRWWAPWASTIPRRPVLTIPDLLERRRPAFRWRGVAWASCRDPDWAARNFVNGYGVTETSDSSPTGGAVRYAG